MEVELPQPNTAANIDEVDGIQFEEQTEWVVAKFAIEAYQDDYTKQEAGTKDDQDIIQLPPLSSQHVSHQLPKRRAQQLHPTREYYNLGLKLQKMSDNLRKDVKQEIQERVREQNIWKRMDISQMYEPFKAIVKGLFDNDVDIHTITTFQAFGYEFAKYLCGERFARDMSVYIRFMVRFIHEEKIIPGAEGENPITIADWVANNGGWSAVFTAGMGAAYTTTRQVASKPIITWKFVAIVNTVMLSVMLLGRKFM